MPAIIALDLLPSNINHISKQEVSKLGIGDKFTNAFSRLGMAGEKLN